MPSAPWIVFAAIYGKVAVIAAVEAFMVAKRAMGRVFAITISFSDAIIEAFTIPPFALWTVVTTFGRFGYSVANSP